METLKTLRFRVEEKNIAIITLNRPEVLNAISVEMLKELEQVIRVIKQNKNLRVVIVTGNGKAFSVGADIKLVKEMTTGEYWEDIETGQRVYTELENLPIPVIAALNGYTLGGGCELALACDIRLASPEVKIGFPEVNLGTFPGWGGIHRLVRLIGIAKAKELLLTGELISAQEALQLGLINKIVPPEKLMDEALEFARKLREKAPIAVANIKALVNSAFDVSLQAALEHELVACVYCFNTKDFKEGLKAFFEKRKPLFKGM